MNRTLADHLYGLWLPMPVFSMHLPSISDEPDGNDADDDAEVDVAFLKNKSTVCPGEGCYAFAALTLACKNFNMPSSSFLSTCFSNHDILWAQWELSFLKETIISQHP